MNKTDFSLNPQLLQQLKPFLTPIEIPPDLLPVPAGLDPLLRIPEDLVQPAKRLKPVVSVISLPIELPRILQPSEKPLPLHIRAHSLYRIVLAVLPAEITRSKQALLSSSRKSYNQRESQYHPLLFWKNPHNGWLPNSPLKQQKESLFRRARS